MSDRMNLLSGTWVCCCISIVQLCRSMKACMHLQSAIYCHIFGNFNCMVCLIVAFFSVGYVHCMSCPVLPYIIVIWNNCGMVQVKISSAGEDEELS